MIEFALVVLLVLLPLALRLYTARHMGQMQERVRDHDEQYRSLQRELAGLVEACRETRREQRHYAARRARLLAEVGMAHAELAALRRPEARRLAA